MSITTSSAPTAALAPKPGTAPRRPGRAAGLLAAVLGLGVIVLLSLAVGARPVSLGEAWRGLFDPASPAYIVVHQMRLPRTLLGLLTGAALGVAGAVMQSMTRNPLADPGILGINMGAAAAVVSAISFLGVVSYSGFVWFAFAGAGAVAFLLYAVGGGRSATPTRLALAGAAINAALYSYVTAVQLLDTAALDRMRFWLVGSLASAQPSTLWRLAPFIVVGLAGALLLARPLNALAMGDDAAQSLGADPVRTRLAGIAVIAVLCGAATAACGPVSFVGLMVPHLVRAITGPDMRWLLPYCAVLSPALMLVADVLGRVVARPGEVQAGVITVLLGGPVFLYFVRRRRVVAE
ncbi:FecCD family ABC transporter permease [Spirillospora sp. NPDC127200]